MSAPPSLLSERMESKKPLPVESVFIPPKLVLRESSNRQKHSPSRADAEKA